MAAITTGGGAYEVRVQEFPQPHTQTEEMGIPAAVSEWQTDNAPNTEVGGGNVDRVFPPLWLGSVGTGNPMWIIVYTVILTHAH